MSVRLVFDFAHIAGHVTRRVFTNPSTILTAHDASEVADVIQAVDAATQAGAYAAGFISYEAAPAFEPSATVKAGGHTPLASFGIFESPHPGFVQQNSITPQVSAWVLDTHFADYNAALTTIHDAIERGDTYQINYTLRTHAQLIGDGFAYYEQLRRAQRADYCAYLDWGDVQVLSISPELFFTRTGDSVVTRPMKGTARRGVMPDEDAALGKWLYESRKNRAENLMIVDLLRNDLSRLAELGGVTVPALFTIERYPTVMQMTSTVQATLRPHVALWDVLAALFPCGSITGAPKLKSMEIIAALEKTPRGPYCGAVGYIKPGGDAVFNVAIRSVVLTTKTGAMECGLGGGITWDSNPVEEFEEVKTKAQFLEHRSAGFDLIETLRLEQGRLTLRHRHHARLSASAAALGFPKPTALLDVALDEFAAQYPKGVYRVRLLYSVAGTVHLEGFALDDAGSGLGSDPNLGSDPKPTKSAKTVSVDIAQGSVSSHDLFLRHKTTRRTVYEHYFQQAEPDTFDVLLWNERGEVTEFTRGNVVAEINGRRITPPLSCGLLSGTLRQELLEEEQIEERILTLQELQRVSALWFINGVRGWVPVKLTPDRITQAQLRQQAGDLPLITPVEG